MTYAVLWTRPALQQFLDLWTSAADPDAVDAAATRIDQTLSLDADLQGESRQHDVRILFVPPLAALFVADASLGIAHVVSVGWSGPPA